MEKILLFLLIYWNLADDYVVSIQTSLLSMYFLRTEMVYSCSENSPFRTIAEHQKRRTFYLGMPLLPWRRGYPWSLQKYLWRIGSHWSQRAQIRRQSRTFLTIIPIFHYSIIPLPLIMDMLDENPTTAAALKKFRDVKILWKIFLSLCYDYKGEIW